MTDNLKLIILNAAIIAFVIAIIIILLILKHKENKKNMNEEKTNIGEIEPSGNDLINKELTLQELELLNTASAYNGEQHKAICGKAALELIEYKKIEDELGIDLRKLGKAFVIIKNKRVNIDLLLICHETKQPVKNYNKTLLACNSGKLTKEEYELLKEVLL